MEHPVPLPEWWPVLFPPPFVEVPPDLPPWPENAATRQLALSLGRAHADGLAAFGRIGAAHGGGLFGIAKGVVADYERLGYLSSADSRRILACCEAFAKAGASEADRTSSAQVIQQQLDEASYDPNAKPFGLAVLGIAASGASRLAANSAETHAVAADFAVGLFGGGLPGGAIASALVLHVDVHVTFS